MYSPFPYQIAQQRLADLRRQAQRDALVTAARESRQARKSLPGHGAARQPVIVVRRVLAGWSSHP